MTKKELEECLCDGICDSISQKVVRDFEVVGNIHDDEWKQFRDHL